MQIYAAFLEKTIFQLANFIYAILILILGLFLSNLIRKLVVSIFDAINVDAIFKILRLNGVLEKADIKLSPAKLLGEIFYWFLIFFLISTVAFFVGLPIQFVLDKIFSYLALIMLGAVTLAFGSFLGVFLGNFVYLIAVNVGFVGAKTIARLVQYAAVVMTFLFALEQLGIGPTLLIPSIGVIIGALGLAIAIAFGLGCKDIMADFVSNLIKGK